MLNPKSGNLFIDKKWTHQMARMAAHKNELHSAP